MYYIIWLNRSLVRILLIHGGYEIGKRAALLVVVPLPCDTKCASEKSR